jgi:hypothetical protein
MGRPIGSRERILSLFLRSPVCEQILIEYAHKEVALENIYFWRSVTSYLDQHEQDSEEVRRRREDEMIEKFLKPGTELEINISASIRKSVLNCPSDIEGWILMKTEVANMILDGQVLRLSENVSDRVRDSWGSAMAKAEESLATKFYSEAFRLEPDLRLFFKGDLRKLEQMWTKMIATSVNLLDNFGQLFQVNDRSGN